MDTTRRPDSIDAKASAAPAAAALATPEALAEAATAYRSRLLAAADRLVRDPDEAEDVVQEAVLAALRSLHRFRGDSQLSSWLYRITVNCALMRLRSRRRRPTVALDEVSNGEAEWPDANLPAADERLWQRERLHAVRDSMESLSDVQREALLLRGVQELPVGEVAKRLGRTPNAAKMLVHRARERVRGDLELLDSAA
ncbi:MAG: RNA polymerase sigma factor [Myxococcota bacterium]